MAYVIGTAYTRPAVKTGHKVFDLVKTALLDALNTKKIDYRQLDGFITVPSLAEPRFMVISFYYSIIYLNIFALFF